MISLVMLIISLFLDGLISTLVPLNYPLQPLLTLTTVYTMYPTFKRKNNKYHIISFVVGIAYDLLYTNCFLLNAIVFTIISYLTKYLYATYEQTKITKVIYLIIIITSYEIIISLILFIFQITYIKISMIFYKISISLLFNIIYCLVITKFINNKA